MESYTKEQIKSAILDEYKREFGTLADENERNGYFIAGFVMSALDKLPTKESEMPKVEGTIINGNNDEWEAACPYCESMNEFSGFFDPQSIYKCINCVAKFQITKIWLTDSQYIN